MEMVIFIGAGALVVGAFVGVAAIVKRRRRMPAQFFHREALERHTLNHAGRGNQELIDKSIEGVE